MSAKNAATLSTQTGASGSAESDVLGPFAEAHDFTCSACGRVGGRVGVDDDEWQQVGDALICAPCVLPPGVTQP